MIDVQLESCVSGLFLQTGLSAEPGLPVVFLIHCVISRHSSERRDPLGQERQAAKAH